MKKLLDELEVARDSADSIKEAQAAQLCINIVRAYNPWHEVGELPEMRNKDYSMRVMVVNSNGRQCFGYFYLPSRQWFDTYDATEIIEPAKWAYLPEVKP